MKAKHVNVQLKAVVPSLKKAKDVTICSARCAIFTSAGSAIIRVINNPKSMDICERTMELSAQNGLSISICIQTSKGSSHQPADSASSRPKTYRTTWTWTSRKIGNHFKSRVYACLEHFGLKIANTFLPWKVAYYISRNNYRGTFIATKRGEGH
ncbi:unnamed protein product [Cylicocyclus nassatus]|uniref:Uncharacterized protein n=1 Tax=Cylicocyclus nassatus TaxID=53992 RepID=A0AA36H249_CYLNA|nr:unnamed protein product [Cylicocyclus nassatus]